MKRTVCILALMLACISVLAGCQCKHEWDSATCAEPKLCQFCGVTGGEPLGHSWKPATCSAPKTCEVCNLTEGKSLTHIWADATCTAPKTCSVCAAAEGAPLGHDWQTDTCETPQTCTVCAAVNGTAAGHTWIDATCDSCKICQVCKLTEGDALGHKWTDATTEAPKTCTACGKTEGNPITTDARFTTAACQKLFGAWEASVEYTAGDLGLTNMTGSFSEITIFTFHNDGTVTVSFDIENKDTYKTLLSASIAEGIYANHSRKEAADQYMLTHSGMTVEEYAAAYAEARLDELLTATQEGVYYIKENTLWWGYRWDTQLDSYEMTLKNNKLTLIDNYNEKTELTRR